MYEEYIGKRVQIELEEASMLYGKYISGQAVEYMLADEDEEQIENEILIENENGLISVRESEIRTIAIVEKTARLRQGGFSSPFSRHSGRSS